MNDSEFRNLGGGFIEIFFYKGKIRRDTSSNYKETVTKMAGKY